jgi:crotonobetainyl-CoA hydratase
MGRREVRSENTKEILMGVAMFVETLVSSEEADWSHTKQEFDVLVRSHDAKQGPLGFARKRQPIWKAR